MKLARISSFRYVLILAVLFAVPFSSPFFPRSISAGESAADETSLFRAGMEHYRAGDYEEAISAFNELLEVNPERRDAERQVERSRTAIERREREQRVAEERRLEEERRAAERRAEEERLAEERRREEEARRQAEEQRAREDAIFSAGMEHYRAGDYEDAISAFNELLEVNPDRRDARTYIARAEREIERREREKELAEQRRREEEARREAEAQREKEDEMFSAGMEHYRAGDYEDAISAFNELLELNPDRRDAERQIERSRTAIERREREQRIAEERRLEEERRAAERRAEEERLAEERRREEEARREAEAQREKEDAIFSAGMEYYRAGDYEDAISSFNELLEVNPDRRDAERQIARSRTAIERREREKELAEQRRREEERLAEERRREEEARRQAEEQRAREDAMFSAGMEHYRAGDYEEAISSFNELLEVNPERRDAERQVARSRTAIERREREQRVAEERRLEEERRAAERRAEEERLAEERRREEEARRQAEEQRAREDEIFSAGMEHYRAGDYEEAISAFNELLEVNPDRRDAERQVARSRTAIERREREQRIAEERRLEEERRAAERRAEEERLAEERRREEEARRQAEEQRAREDAMFSAGMEHYRAGDYEEAISAFNELLEVNPEHRDALRYKSGTMLAMERAERRDRKKEAERASKERVEAYRSAHREALMTVEELAEARDAEVSELMEKGVESFIEGDYDAAIVWFSRVFEIVPDHGPAARYIEVVEREKERREKELIREAERAELKEELAEIREERAAERIRAREQRLIERYLKQGDDYFRAGRYEHAIGRWEKVLEIDSQHSAALSKIRGAENEIDRRERIAENERLAARKLAEGHAAYRRGDYASAVSSLEEVPDLVPRDHPDYQRAVSAAQASRIAGIRADRRDARSLRDLTQRSQIMGIAEAWTPAERLRRDPDPVDRPEDPSRERRPLAERAREEISVSFERAHIRSVLRYLSEVSNVNIVLDETVFQVEEGLLPGGISPRVSIDLEDVPLIDALDVILRAKNLRYRLEENIIWITTPERLERERLVTKTYTLLSPVAGTVQFMMPDWEVDDRDDDERVRVLIDDDEEDEDTLVGVETVIDTLRESVSWPAGSILTFDERTGSLIVRNTPSNLRVLEDIIRMLEEPPGQVAIQTRFMTVRVSDLRRVESEFTDMFFDLGDGDLEIPRTGVGSRIGGTSGLSLDYERLSPTQFSYFLDALETKESSNLLSAPTILTRNQQEATIRVVRERWLPSDSWEVFYYYDPDEPGIPVQRSFLIPTSLDDEPIEDGIILLVRPEIGADMRTVTLDVRPIISEFLGFETFGAGDDLTQYAQVAERTIRTNVMVGDGETIVMGGLITESKRDRLTKVPLLGDVPLLGRLFSSTRTETDKESLLIFITVDLITPTGAKYRER